MFKLVRQNFSAPAAAFLFINTEKRNNNKSDKNKQTLNKAGISTAENHFPVFIRKLADGKSLALPEA
ncbi:hypothetical protein [Sporolactobacillus laevolacticus]|uniref:hypothetical protein n=1 Tax=Sporolactobacillus laevolacticus TaxID=33018 RepID=UPI0004192F71|nr:hypothetical protein [Sporolactobacillus laevolacticus]